MNISRFDEKIIYFERLSSNLSKVPVLGIISGGLKAIFGSLQMITALVVTILLAIPLLFINRDLLRWSASHIIHGFLNVINGAIEAIPIIGTIVVIVRNNLSVSRIEKKSLDHIQNSLGESSSMTWINYRSMRNSNYPNFMIENSVKAERQSKAIAYLAII